MTARDKQPRTRLEAVFTKYNLKRAQVARLVGINNMRINRLQRGIAHADRGLRDKLLRAIRFLADDYSIKEADLFPVDEYSEDE
jgi:transcriptional regulator with XRE-family HTH domain